MIAPKPNIIFKGSPNYNTGHPINPNAPSPQPQQPVAAIIDHITEGGRNSVLAEFQSEASQASTHFMVCTDGQIWQFVDLANSAWGNGIWEAPDVSVPWISDAFKNGKWPNGCTISIEHEGTHGVPLTEPQYQSTLALQQWLLSLYKLPTDRNHINGHYQIQSRNRANCPGSAYPWARLMGDLQTMNPNPNNLNVGKGFLDYLQNVIHEQAAIEERYIKNAPGGVSVLRTMQGSLLMATQDVAANGTYLASWTITKLA